VNWPESSRTSSAVCARHERLALRKLAGGRRDHVADGQVVSLGEGVVTFVVGGDGHDRARPVPGQHIVRDPDGDALVGERVDCEGADEDAALLAIRAEPIDLCLAASGGNVGFDLGPVLGRGEGRHQRMLRCEHHEGGAVDRVGSRGEHADSLGPSTLDGEVDLRAL